MPSVYHFEKHNAEPSIESEKREESCQICIPTRYTIIILNCFALFLLFMFGSNLSVALVKMVNLESGNITAENKTYNQEGDFNWSEKLQGTIITVFGVAYAIGSLIGGRLGEILGSKRIIGIGVFIMSVLNLLIPLAAYASVYLLLVLRIFQGFLAGTITPTANIVVTRWLPSSERSKGVAFLNGAFSLGNVVGNLATGALCKSPLLHGWPLTFYVFGGLGVLWTIACYFIMYESPTEHPWISIKEKEYILVDQMTKKVTDIPYRAILTSVPVWAAVSANIAEAWGTTVLTNDVPFYYANILHYDVQMTGFLAAAPPLAKTFFMCFSGILADYLIRKEFLSRTNARKVMNSFGLLLPAFLLVLVTFVDSKREVPVVIITLVVGFSGFVGAGFKSSQVDLSPSYSGSITGFSIFIGFLVSFISPYITGLVTDHKETPHQWHIVFWINAVFYAMGGLCFLLGGSADVQSWGKEKNEVSDNTP